MASSTQARTAYLYGVPIASESELGTLLNNRSQSDCSIHVDELKQGAAILKIFGSVSWSQLSAMCHNLGFTLLPDVIDSASVHVSTEWVRQIRHCGLDVNTIVKSDVTVIDTGGDVVLKGRWADVNSAISDIKDAIAETFCGALDSSDHRNRRSVKLNGVGAENGSMAGKRRAAAVTVGVDDDRMTAVDRRPNLENSRPVTSPQSRLEIDEYVWHYIAFRYPDMSRHWQQSLMLNQSSTGKVIEIAGQMQDVINFSEWFIKHELISVTRRVINVDSNIDGNHLKKLITSSEAARFGVSVGLVHGNMECIGKANDVDDLISWLEVARRDCRERRITESSADVKYGADVNGSSTAADNVNSPVAGASQPAGKKPVILYADRENLTFRTGESRLTVDVLKGDLTRQKSEVIVNPANRYLLHGGGAAKAIQDAAGHMLISECKDYIRKHKELRTSEVMHTTSGNLPRPTNYVIHACGPDARDCPDDKQCLHLLERTFLNCFMYANDELRVQSLALPAISSGTFSVPIDIVGTAAYNALTEFDSYMSRLPPKKRHLDVINFVNIDKSVTQSLIYVFTVFLRDGSQCMPSANDNQTNHPSDTNDDDSSSTSKLSRQTSPRSRCCVCGKTDNGRTKFVGRETCGHRSCVGCRSAPCNKCGRPLAPAVAQSRKSAEPLQTSPRNFEARAQNSSVDVRTNTTAASSPSHASRPRSNSFRVHSSRSSSKTTATAADGATAKRDRNGKDSGQAADEFSHQPPRRRSRSLTRDDQERHSENSNAEQCVICMDKMTDPKKLECGHVFCSDCIDAAFAHAAKCPCCGHIFGRLKGNQPSGGTMKVRRSGDDLDGYTGAGSLVVMYDIPSGLQQHNHPNPGKMFRGTRRVAYLPATAEGEEICKLLREAFDAGLIFTVGRSHTTGEDNVVIWNDIHHKTSKNGQYGYPDFTYLSRVRSELAAKGIGSTSTVGSGAAASAEPPTSASSALSTPSSTSVPSRRVVSNSVYASAAVHTAACQPSTNADCGRHSPRFVAASVASARDDSTSQYGTDASSLLPLSSPSYVTANSNPSTAARHLDAVSTVDRSHRGSTGFTTTQTYPHTSALSGVSLSSHGSYAARGPATRSSRHSAYAGFQPSATHHSSSTSAPASQHSAAMSRTGVYDRSRRYH